MIKLVGSFAVTVSLLFAGVVAAQQKPVDKSGTLFIFDNSETYPLSQPSVRVEGEVKNPGSVALESLPLRSLIVKESRVRADSLTFSGAYRYDGYSLIDILNGFVVNKANADAFPPQIDMYIEVVNDKNEKAVFSWGELFYNNQQHSVILATKVMRIIPEKTGELWPLPAENQLVCSYDLATERNIKNPVKIIVKSYSNDTIAIVKGKNPVYSPVLNVYVKNEKKGSLTGYPEKQILKTIHTIFYGKGRGLHSTKPYQGLSMGDWLKSQVVSSQRAIQNGLWVLVSDDGYRSVFSYSELCNRNDNGEAILNFDADNKNGGAFRLVAGFDFFSDRAVKSVREIIYIEP